MCDVNVMSLVQHSAFHVQAKEEPSPPDSPHLRSGTSSFSHISSPASYHFGNSDDEGSDSDSSQWTSDGEVCTPSLVALEQRCGKHFSS